MIQMGIHIPGFPSIKSIKTKRQIQKPCQKKHMYFTYPLYKMVSTSIWAMSPEYSCIKSRS